MWYVALRVNCRKLEDNDKRNNFFFSPIANGIPYVLVLLI